MGGLFSTEGALYRSMAALADLVLLNLLWLVTSIPIVTLGASFTALWAAVLHMARGKESSAAAVYLESFRKNWKEASLLWLLYGGLLLITVINMNLCRQIPALAGLRLAFPILGILLCGGMLYAFALQAVFANSLKKTLRYSLILSIGYLPQTIGMLLVAALPLLLVITATRGMLGLFLGLVLSVSLAARVNAQIMYGILKRFLP